MLLGVNKGVTYLANTCSYSTVLSSENVVQYRLWMVDDAVPAARFEPFKDKCLTGCAGLCLAVYSYSTHIYETLNVGRGPPYRAKFQ